MRKVFNLSEDLDKDLYNTFLDFYNEFQDEHIEIHMDCIGGLVSFKEGIVRLINLNPQNFTMVVTGRAYSSALHLLFEVKCKKIITDNAVGLLHKNRIYTSVDMSGVELNKQTRSYYEGLKWMEKTNEKDLFDKLSLSEKQQEAYREGEDIYFNYLELKNIINKWETHGKVHGY